MIALEGVTKVYRTGWRRRAVRAVDDLSLAVLPGEIFGIAGPNGAGKSTLINMILGFLRPTTGKVTLDGRAPRAYVEARGVGYLSELVAIPPTWSAEGALTRYAVLAGVPARQRAGRVEDAIARLGLDEHRRKKVKQLSKGNLQRLGLAQALLSESELVILDEPTHGFDPIWTQRFRDIARDLRRPGRTVVIASHNLDELERVADRVGIIDRGRLQHIATIGDHATGGAMSYRLRLAQASDAVTRVFTGAAPAGDGQAGEYLVPALELAALNVGLKRLIEEGAQIVAVMPERSRLEATFRSAVRSDA